MSHHASPVLSLLFRLGQPNRKQQDGIPVGATHSEYHGLAMKFNNVVALNHKKSHTLPAGVFFFKVESSKVQDTKSTADKLISSIQVPNPDCLETTSACLTKDLQGVVVTVSDLDKFVHKHHDGIGNAIGESVNNIGNARSRHVSMLDNEAPDILTVPLHNSHRFFFIVEQSCM
jgi:hypothetical protein